MIQQLTDDVLKRVREAKLLLTQQYGIDQEKVQRKVELRRQRTLQDITEDKNRYGS